MANTLSVVIPVFNSAATLLQLCESINRTYPADDIEIILVDDGSSDKSWEKIKELKAVYGSRIKGIRLSQNYGQHNATLCGIHHASKEYVATMDDDMQYLPESIALLQQTLEEGNFDMVYGMPKVKKQSIVRILGNNILTLIGRLFNEKPQRASAFRLMKKELASRLKIYKPYYLLIDVLIRWHTSRIGYRLVPHHSRRRDTESGYSTEALIKMGVRSLIGYSAIPYKLFMIAFLLSSLSYLYVLLSYRIAGHYLHWLVTATSAFLITLFALGFGMLFAYLYHIVNYLNNRPCYTIAEEI